MKTLLTLLIASVAFAADVTPTSPKVPTIPEKTLTDVWRTAFQLHLTQDDLAEREKAAKAAQEALAKACGDGWRVKPSQDGAQFTCEANPAAPAK